MAMNGYFSSIVRRSQPAVAGLRANLFTAPAQDPGAGEGPVAAERVVAEHPGKSAAGANERADHPDIAVRHEENKTDRRQPGAAERLAENVLLPGRPSGEGSGRVEIERSGERISPERGQRVDQVVERHSTIEWVPERQSDTQQPAGLRSESEAIPVVALTSTPASTVTPAPAAATGQAQQPSNPATPKEAQRIVAANAAFEKPLAPAAQPRPALVIGKITVEVQAPPSPAVSAAARAAAAAKNRRPRAAAPARRQLPHDPSKLGFGLGQL
jgi:hypothetical protein